MILSASEDTTSPRRSVGPNVVRGMAIRCLLALTVLAVMALAGYLVNRGRTRLLTDHATLVQLAGRQQALVSRLGLLIQRLGETSDANERHTTVVNLAELAQQLQQVHTTILYGNEQQGRSAAPPAVRSVYLDKPHELDRQLKQLVGDVRRVIKSDDAETSPPQSVARRIAASAGDIHLLDSLEAVLTAYEAEGRKAHAELRMLETVILMLTLWLIAATGAGVFWPMVRQVRSETDQLESANAVLDQRAAELAATLHELEMERDERHTRMQTMARVMEDLEEQRGKLEREIQARQLVQEALEASEQRFYGIIESAPTAMVITDQQGYIVLVNAETERLFGYSRDEILNQPIEVLVPRHFRDKHPEFRAGFFVNPETRRMGAGRELYGLRKDGTEVPLEIGLNPIEADEGLFVLSAIVDITERKRHDEILRQSEERVRSIVDSALDAVVTMDEAGNITGWNPQAEVVFGWSATEVHGKPMADLIIPENWREAHRRGLAKFLATGEAVVFNQRLELTAIRKQGEPFPVEIAISPLRVGEHYEFSAFVRDITARKRAEEEIKRINKELQRKNHEMQQFVYTVSHDLKSPLVTCRGFVGLMKEDAAEGRWNDVLDSVVRIERASERMGDLIEDLLQLSRIGVIRNEPEEVDVGKMIHSIAEELADRLQQAGVTLEIQDNLPHVFADHVRLAEVFENLLSNAIKYGCRNGNGHIVVGGHHGEGEVQYFVRDNGPGIAKEFHQKVFGLFQRLESNQDGTGVGLAAVARILEIHGGRAWVESDLGQGATFWFAFPTSADRTMNETKRDRREQLGMSPIGTLSAGS